MALNNLLTVAQLPQSKALNNEIITSYIDPTGNPWDVWWYCRYQQQDLIRYRCWEPNGNMHNRDELKETPWTTGLYEARHEPHPNIPSNDKINDFNWTVADNTRIWALTDKGHIYAAGYNPDGLMGVPANLNDNGNVCTYFTQVPNVTGVVKLLPAWYSHFIKENGTLWVQSSSYSTVNGGNAYTWSQDTGISSVYEVKGNSGHTAFYVLKQDGTVYVKGKVASTTTDSLGLGSTTEVTSWTKLSSLSNIVKLHTTNYTYSNSVNENFAINSSGKVYAWGYNNKRQLATDSTSDLVTTPTLCTKVNSLNVKGIASLAGNCTLFLTTDGYVYHVGDYSADGSSTVSNRTAPAKLANVENVKDLYFENRCYYAWAVRYDGFYYMIKPVNASLTNLSSSGIVLVTDYNFLADKLEDVTGTYTASNGTKYYYKQVFTYGVGTSTDTVRVYSTLSYGTSTNYGTTYGSVNTNFNQSTFTSARTTMTSQAASQVTSWEQAIDPAAFFNPNDITDPGVITSGSWTLNSGKTMYYRVIGAVTSRTSTTATITYTTQYGLTSSYGTQFSQKTHNVTKDNKDTYGSELSSLATTEVNSLKSSATYNMLNISRAADATGEYTSPVTGIKYYYKTTFTQGTADLSSNTINVTTVYGKTTSYGNTFKTDALSWSTSSYANAATNQASAKSTQVTNLQSKLDTLIGDVSLPSPNPKTWSITTSSGKTIYLQTTYAKA